MKIVSENPPLVIELYHIWPERVKGDCFFNIQLELLVIGLKVFSLKVLMYRNPFDFETYFTLFGFGVEIANCE